MSKSLTPGSSEPEIGIAGREQLLYLLAEAAEIEHGLMCCYLFAAFSLRTSTDEGLSEHELEQVKGWRRSIMAVALEEMTHLALVTNLTIALGGAPHFERRNFPVPPGLHPSGIDVRLAPFDRETLQHFIYLERPEGMDVRDGEGFARPSGYARATVVGKCMPSAQDYHTVGHLYRAIRSGVEALVARLGEAAVFVGEPIGQVGPDVARLPGLLEVSGLETAIEAINTILEQGEGTQEASPDSHFCRFCAIAEGYDLILAVRPDFAPARPVALNPVMRRPPDASDKVFIDHPQAAAILDVANAVYGHMLRFLSQAFGYPGPKVEQQALVEAATELMQALSLLGEDLSRQPATPSKPGINAGLSFAMLRSVAALPHGVSEWRLLSQRLDEIASATTALTEAGPSVVMAARSLDVISKRLARRARSLRHPGKPAPKTVAEEPDEGAQGASAQVANGVDVATGKHITLKFEAKRCIHARFCVLGLPHVYQANVAGAWITPDAATLEANIQVAHNCPSGAIQYDRHDGGPPEAAPPVNLISVRENGPYAFRAPLTIDGLAKRFRATLCRCGASKSKPYCDGSHAEIGFLATGEPPPGTMATLEARDGGVDVLPQHNGPLIVEGNVEILSGTGRTIAKLTGARLCRCGHSGSKPHCDGSHARVGFTSD